jgi:hypothetical protein
LPEGASAGELMAAVFLECIKDAQEWLERDTYAYLKETGEIDG